MKARMSTFDTPAKVWLNSSLVRGEVTLNTFEGLSTLSGMEHPQEVLLPNSMRFAPGLYLW